jgi:flagellar hook-length control protein FliK
MDAAALAAAANGAPVVTAPTILAPASSTAGNDASSIGVSSGGAPSTGLAVKGIPVPRSIGAGISTMATGKPPASTPFPLNAAAPPGTHDSRDNAAADAAARATSTAADSVASAAAGLSATDTPSVDSIAAPVDADTSKPEPRVNAMTGPGANAASAGADATPPVAASTALTEAAQLAQAALNPVGVEKHGHEVQGAVAAAGPAAAVGGSADATAGAAGTGVSAPAASTDSPAAVAGKLNAPLGSPAFPQELAARVAYVVANSLNGATLQVNPPQLGPIELRVTVEAGHAQVMLSAQNSATCDALQASSAKLKEMLSPGFAQVSVDVSQRSFQERSAYSQTYQWTPAADAEGDAVNTASAVHSNPAAAAARGLDAYA